MTDDHDPWLRPEQRACIAIAALCDEADKDAARLGISDGVVRSSTIRAMLAGATITEPEA